MQGVKALILTAFISHIAALVAFEYTIEKDSVVCTAYSKLIAELPYHVCDSAGLCANYTALRPFLFDGFECHLVKIDSNVNVTLIEDTSRSLEVMLHDAKTYVLVAGGFVFNVVAFLIFALYKCYAARKKEVGKSSWYKNKDGDYVQRTVFDFRSGEPLDEDDMVRLSRQLNTEKKGADDELLV